MAKVTVYLPDALEREVREAGSLNVSAICQRALRAALRDGTSDPVDLIEVALDMLEVARDRLTLEKTP